VVYNRTPNKINDQRGSMSTQALIQATALNRYYGKYHAVNDFNLTLHKGEVLGLLGPNGAGKSTTMQMLTGNISPSSGKIKINGIDLHDDPLSAKQSIGYLPEQPPVYRDMTPLEFLTYCAALHNIPKKQRKKFLEKTLERCGLEQVYNKLIGNLSKGYQQRVGIAQAILHQPDLVILDEPTVGLDPIQITQIRALIRELGNDHSVILSTHILPEVQAVCDRVQIINQGKTVFSDSFEQLEKQSSTSLIVSFSQGGDKEKLATLPDIANIKLVSAENNKHPKYQLTFHHQPDPAKVFNLAIEQGWILDELTTDKQTLEQIFTHLIHNDSTNDIAQTTAKPSKDELETEKHVKIGGVV